MLAFLLFDKQKFSVFLILSMYLVLKMIWTFFMILIDIKQEHAVTMPTTWVMACSYGPTGDVVACG